MAKVHILGGPGSGKSTLARYLSATLSIPHYDLDILGQRNGTNPEAHINDSLSISKMSGWVVEGIYLVLIDPLLYEADYIVLLDISWRVAAWRIIKRHLVTTFRGTNQYPGWRSLRNLLEYARNYYLGKPHRAELMSRCLREHQAMNLPPTHETMVRFLDMYHEVSIPPTREFVHLYLGKYQEKVVLLKNNRDRRRLIRLLGINSIEGNDSHRSSIHQL